MSREIKRTDIGEKIRAKRKQLRLTQFDMADKLNIKRNTYARYETDTVPPLHILKNIGEVLGLTADELLYDDINYTSQNSANIQILRFRGFNSYNVDNNDLTDEEILTLYKIVNLSPEKREQLINYIATVVEDESLI